MANAFDRTQYPEIEPDQLVAGDRWMWRRRLSDYPATLYTLSYEARSGATVPTRISITATASGTDHIVEVASTATVAFEAGNYSWIAFITRDSDSERIEIGRGSFVVKPNAATDNDDPRTFAHRMVDKLRAAIEALASNSVSSYSIGDRTVTKRDLTALTQDLARYEARRAAEVQQERVRRGLPSNRTIRARF